jgi:hypothetical protein
MNKIISTKDLTISDLPRKNANWDRISSFALTWDPKVELIDKQYHFSLNHLPNEGSSIIEIRAYIYQQQRSWNHQSREPDSKSLQKIHQAIELLRNKIQEK